MNNVHTVLEIVSLYGGICFGVITGVSYSLHKKGKVDYKWKSEGEFYLKLGKVCKVITICLFTCLCLLVMSSQ